jgi:AraC-like DNA-binding protein
MVNEFLPEKDILIYHRQDDVASYMSPTSHKSAPHLHYQYELLLTVGGTADFVVGESCYAIAEGSFLFINNMEPHYIRASSPGYDRYTLRFSSEALAAGLHDPVLMSAFKHSSMNFCHHYCCAAEQARRFTAIVRRMAAEYEEQDVYWAQMILSRLHILMMELYRSNPAFFPVQQSTESQRLVLDAQNYIETHLQEELTLDLVADHFFVNKFHLSHSFTRVTGYSFKQFIIAARIAKAKDLLLNTSTGISAVGAQVGFPNSSHFIRTFKTNEGVTPLQYRNRAFK